MSAKGCDKMKEENTILFYGLCKERSVCENKPDALSIYPRQNAKIQETYYVFVTANADLFCYIGNPITKKESEVLQKSKKQIQDHCIKQMKILAWQYCPV